MSLAHAGPVNSTVEARLGTFVGGDPGRLLQLLLVDSSRETFARILDCPDYPAPIRSVAAREASAELIRIGKQSPSGLSNKLSELMGRALTPEYRKKRGQFATPMETAHAALSMLGIQPGEFVLDPGCGPATFGAALLESRGPVDEIEYCGVENDPLAALAAAVVLETAGAPRTWKVQYANYLLLSELKNGRKPMRIICNPPFVRYQSIPNRRAMSSRISRRTGLRVSQLSGSHSYFLAQSFNMLAPGGAMVFLLPPETDGAHHSSLLIAQIMLHAEAVESVAIGAPPVPDGRQSPAYSRALMRFLCVRGKIAEGSQKDAKVSAPPPAKAVIPLSILASVRRGISTGDNDFFTLTKGEIKEARISRKWLRAIIPTKVVLPESITTQIWEQWEESGEKCWILSIPKSLTEGKLPAEIRAYLSEGVRRGTKSRPTSIKRTPWYSVPIPEAGPPIVFTYMSRGTPRFVANPKRYLNLTNLLGVHLALASAQRDEAEFPQIAADLSQAVGKWVSTARVGRTYRDALLKIEPGELERMPIGDSPRLKRLSKSATLDSFY